MINLNDYLFESEGTSDNAILYRMGKYRLSYFPPDRAKSVIKRFRINKQDPRPGLIRYMKYDTVPIMPDKDEIIHRKDWHLNSLVGETEGQLLHPDYYKLNKHIVTNHKRHHDTLTIFQCSSKKPYTENRMLKSDYFSIYKDYTDFACISNPGIIPIEFCSYYPYRYDEWNVMAEEKVEDLIDLTHKYRIVNMCRFIRYVKSLGYKDVICVIGNPKKQWIFDTMLKKNIEGAKDWLHVVTNDTFRNRLAQKSKYSKLASNGMFGTRIPGLPETRKAYERALKATLGGDEKDSFADLVKKNDERLAKGRSNRVNENFTLKNSINYTDILKKFKESIEDNMKNGEVDKGDNDLYYKSYYWTALDILLIGLDEDIVEDIDGAYWDLVSSLTKDSDFEKLGDYVFAYKPLMKKDDVHMDTIKNEAYEIKLVKDDKDFKLDPKIFD